MPTIFTHPAVPLTLQVVMGKGVVSKRLLFAGVIGSILPDLDVLAFSFGIPYGHPFGHRGFTHSFLFAAFVALVVASMFRLLHTTLVKAFLFLLISVGSHGVLDAFTNGGRGIAFFWPLSAARYFSPFRPVVVAPVEISLFFSSIGLHVLHSELLWVWAPCILAGAIMTLWRRWR
ncbi:MAG: metal-dependent hydrolase [Candidatus Binatia bacterium]